jgi:hypothetical protein
VPAMAEAVKEAARRSEEARTHLEKVDTEEASPLP